MRSQLIREGLLKAVQAGVAHPLNLENMLFLLRSPNNSRRRSMDIKPVIGRNFHGTFLDARLEQPGPISSRS